MTTTDEALLRLIRASADPSTSPSPTAAPVVGRPATMPDHVKRLLAQRGDMDADTGATHNARVTRCPRCRLAVFIGLIVGLTYTCDTPAISDMAEAQALLLGRRTFTARFNWDRISLEWRGGKWAPPSSHPDIDILVDHQCGNHYQFERIASVADRRLMQPTPENPPF